MNPIGPRGVYDEAKRYAEALTMAYLRQQGVDTCIARIFNSILADEQVLYDDGGELRRRLVEALAARLSRAAVSRAATRLAEARTSASQSSSTRSRVSPCPRSPGAAHDRAPPRPRSSAHPPLGAATR